MSYVELERAITYSSVESLPQNGNGLCRFLIDELDFVSRARLKYPEIANTLDQSYELQRQAYLKEPTDLNLRKLRRNMGSVGAFNFIEHMSPVSLDGSENGSIASGMKLGPGAAAQVLKIADIQDTDRVLELFSGAGYFTFSLALAQPQSLESIDLYSSEIYDLGSTFDSTYERIFSRAPDKLKPLFTSPRFIKGDCTDLAKLSLIGSDKVFLHPPFGRESRKIVDLDEIKAYVLWLKSLLSVYATNSSDLFQTYSIVPGEWIDALLEQQENGVEIEESIKSLKAKLGLEDTRSNSDLSITESEWRQIELILKTAESYTIQSRRVKIKLLKTRYIDPNNSLEAQAN